MVTCLEAALIVGIVLAYLARTGNRDKFGSVWLGTGAAVLVSLIAGGVIFATVGKLEGRAEELFEGLAMLVAVVVLSYMVIWMKRQAMNIRAHLHAQVNAALRSRSAMAVGVLAFVVVVREGVETALFMFAATRGATAWESTVGGLAGLGIATVLGYLIYKGGRRINLRTFFNVTGLLLIFFAGGLLAHGIHELEEAGVIPIIIEHVWNTNNVLNENEGLGSFLKALFGYNGNPSQVEVIAYALYLVGALWHFRSVSNKVI